MNIDDEVFVKGKIVGVTEYTDEEGYRQTDYKIALYNINDEKDDSRIVYCKAGECFKKVVEND